MTIRKPFPVSSLYRHAQSVQALDGSVLFMNPERLPFIDRDDTIIYIASGQDYLWNIAQFHYNKTSIQTIELGEVIAQFQPEPIQDLSIPVQAGRELYIPSWDYIAEVVKGPSLAEEPEL